MKRAREESSEEQQVYVKPAHKDRIYKEWLIFQIDPALDRAMVREFIVTRLYDIKYELVYTTCHVLVEVCSRVTFNTCLTPIRHLSNLLPQSPNRTCYIRFTTSDNVKCTLKYSPRGILTISRLDPNGTKPKLFSCNDFYGLCYLYDKDAVTLDQANELSAIWNTREVSQSMYRQVYGIK